MIHIADGSDEAHTALYVFRPVLPSQWKNKFKRVLFIIADM